MSVLGWSLVAALIWGIVPVMEKVGLGGPAASSAGVVVRSAGVALGALAVAAATSPWTAVTRMPKHSIALLALGGLLASVVGQLAFYQALKHGDVSRVAPLVGTYPLVAALLGWWLLREPLTAMRLVGALLVVGGVLLLR